VSSVIAADQAAYIAAVRIADEAAHCWSNGATRRLAHLAAISRSQRAAVDTAQWCSYTATHESSVGSADHAAVSASHQPALCCAKRSAQRIAIATTDLQAFHTAVGATDGQAK
jgi:hypothetical protein